VYKKDKATLVSQTNNNGGQWRETVEGTSRWACNEANLKYSLLLRSQNLPNLTCQW